MKKRSISLGLCAAALFVSALRAKTELPSTTRAIEVHFSPHGGCTAAVVRELEAANATVLVQAYSFTSAPIAKALVAAHKRGVKVQVTLDKSQQTAKYTSATFLQNASVPTSIDAVHAIAHNKLMVIDESTVITGSFNFTKAAEENNAENLLVIRDRQLAEKYAVNWQAHFSHSKPYDGRAPIAPGGHDAGDTSGAPADLPPSPTTGYVASKNSQVFHRLTCKSVAKIAPRNLVHYPNRPAAVAAGKRPCAECKP